MQAHEQVSVWVAGLPVPPDERPEETVAAVAWARERKGWAWIDTQHLSPERLTQLGNDLGINKLAVEDMLESGQRTKFESYGTDAFLAVHPATFDETSGEISLGEVHLYVGHGFLLTQRAPGTPLTDGALDRVASSRPLALLGPRGGAYAVLDEVVDEYEPAVALISSEIDKIDDDLFARSDNDVATRIYRLSRQVGAFLQAVTPLPAALAQARKSVAGDDLSLLLEGAHLDPQDGETHDGAATPASGTDEADAHGTFPGAGPGPMGAFGGMLGAALGGPWGAPPNETPEHRAARRRESRLLGGLLRDVEDHAQRTAAHLGDIRSTLTNALSLTSTLAAEKASEVGLEQNDQTKKVSSWAAILAAPAVLAGVWGMNFRYMPELELTWGYPTALCTMAAACAGLYVAFKRRGWL